MDTTEFQDASKAQSIAEKLGIVLNQDNQEGIQETVELETVLEKTSKEKSPHKKSELSI